MVSQGIYCQPSFLCDWHIRGSYAEKSCFVSTSHFRNLLTFAGDGGQSQGAACDWPNIFDIPPLRVGFYRNLQMSSSQPSRVSRVLPSGIFLRSCPHSQD